MSPLPSERADYKSVWTNLSVSADQAKAQVIGDVDEEYLQETAQETLEILQRTVGIRPDDTVLEIGCGIGRVGQALSPHCARWIGCDISANMLIHAQQRLQDAPNVTLVELAGSNLDPIRSASVDVAYCTVVFMHLDEWDRYTYVQEALRVLRPGGRVYIDNFNLCSAEGWAIFEGQQRIAPHERPAAISKSSTPVELRTYLERAGFEDVQIVEEQTWVRGWGRKPGEPGDDRPAEPIQTSLSRGEPLASVAAISAHVEELKQQIAALEGVIARKNAHISELTRLLGQIEQGRVMRLLRRFGGH